MSFGRVEMAQGYTSYLAGVRASLGGVRNSLAERPLMVVLSPGHIDEFGERTPDKWAVVRTTSGRIVRLFGTEGEAHDFAGDRNAARLLRRR